MIFRMVFLIQILILLILSKQLIFRDFSVFRGKKL